MRTLLIAVIVLASACVPGNNPLHITGLFPVTANCDLSMTKVGITRGTLDVSGGGTYLLSLRAESELIAPVLEDTNGTDLTTASQNSFIIDEIYLTYTSRNPVIPFAPEREARAAVLAPGEELVLFVNLIGPLAFQKLKDNVTDPLADPKMVLNVSVSLRGHLNSGQAQSTNAIIFPIEVTTTNMTCANGVAPTGPCGTGGGQDGTVVTCL